LNFIGLLVGLKVLVLKIDRHLTLSSHTDVSVDRRDPFVGSDELSTDLTVNVVEVIAHLGLLDGDLSTEGRVGIEADRVGAGGVLPLCPLRVAKDDTTVGTLSSSQHDILTIRARGRDPWNNVHISLTIEAVDINAHIFERLKNKVLEAVLLERVDHDSRREGRGERVVLGSGN
jgi:hypothetical protein